MAEIVNLRRARKAKARAEKDKAADANRVLHGTPAHVRKITKRRAEKAASDLDARKLDPSGDDSD
jgi:hypothetical protein